MLSTKGIVSLISISRSPPLFLWRSSRTAVHHIIIRNKFMKWKGAFESISPPVARQ